MAKHERADVDQYAMTLLLFISIAQHRQHLLVTCDPVEVEFIVVKRFVHVHRLRDRGGSLQRKQTGLVLGHQAELSWDDATTEDVGGQGIVANDGRLATSLELRFEQIGEGVGWVGSLEGVDFVPDDWVQTFLLGDFGSAAASSVCACAGFSGCGGGAGGHDGRRGTWDPHWGDVGVDLRWYLYYWVPASRLGLCLYRPEQK